MKRSFTLLELLIAVIIIGILSVLSVTQFSEAVRKTKETNTKNNLADMRRIQLGYESVSSGWQNNLGICGSAEVDFAVDLNNEDLDDNHCTGYQLRITFNDNDYNYTLAGDNITASAVGAGLSDFIIDLRTGTIL